MANDKQGISIWITTIMMGTDSQEKLKQRTVFLFQNLRNYLISKVCEGQVILWLNFINLFEHIGLYLNSLENLYALKLIKSIWKFNYLE